MSRHYCQRSARGPIQVFMTPYIQSGAMQEPSPVQSNTPMASKTKELKPEGQVKLNDIIMVDGVHLRDVLIAAAGAELVINAVGVAVPGGRDHVITQPICN